MSVCGEAEYSRQLERLNIRPELPAALYIFTQDLGCMWQLELASTSALGSGMYYFHECHRGRIRLWPVKTQLSFSS